MFLSVAFNCSMCVFLLNESNFSRVWLVRDSLFRKQPRPPVVFNMKARYTIGTCVRISLNHSLRGVFIIFSPHYYLISCFVLFLTGLASYSVSYCSEGGDSRALVTSSFSRPISFRKQLFYFFFFLAAL